MTESQRLREYADSFASDMSESDGISGASTDHTVWSCVGNLTAVRSIRARVRDFLEGAQGRGEAVDDAELAASELATNALLHSRSGQVGGVMTLYIRSHASSVRVAVADQGEKQSEDTEPLREADGDYGRGKLIIESCSSRSGEYWTDATHVAWFEIDLPHRQD